MVDVEQGWFTGHAMADSVEEGFEEVQEDVDQNTAHIRATRQAHIEDFTNLQGGISYNRGPADHVPGVVDRIGSRPGRDSNAYQNEEVNAEAEVASGDPPGDRDPGNGGNSNPPFPHGPGRQAYRASLEHKFALMGMPDRSPFALEFATNLNYHGMDGVTASQEAIRRLRHLRDADIQELNHDTADHYDWEPPGGGSGGSGNPGDGDGGDGRQVVVRQEPESGSPGESGETTSTSDASDDDSNGNGNGGDSGPGLVGRAIGGASRGVGGLFGHLRNIPSAAVEGYKSARNYRSDSDEDDDSSWRDRADDYEPEPGVEVEMPDLDDESSEEPSEETSGDIVHIGEGDLRPYKQGVQDPESPVLEPSDWDAGLDESDEVAYDMSVPTSPGEDTDDDLDRKAPQEVPWGDPEEIEVGSGYDDSEDTASQEMSGLEDEDNDEYTWVANPYEDDETFTGPHSRPPKKWEAPEDLVHDGWEYIEAIPRLDFHRGWMTEEEVDTMLRRDVYKDVTRNIPDDDLRSEERGVIEGATEVARALALGEYERPMEDARQDWIEDTDYKNMEEVLVDAGDDAEIVADIVEGSVDEGFTPDGGESDLPFADDEAADTLGTFIEMPTDDEPVTEPDYDQGPEPVVPPTEPEEESGEGANSSSSNGEGDSTDPLGSSNEDTGSGETTSTSETGKADRNNYAKLTYRTDVGRSVTWKGAPDDIEEGMEITEVGQEHLHELEGREEDLTLDEEDE